VFTGSPAARHGGGLPASPGPACRNISFTAARICSHVGSDGDADVVPSSSAPVQVRAPSVSAYAKYVVSECDPGTSCAGSVACRRAS